jgi:hypothetical protein
MVPRPYLALFSRTGPALRKKRDKRSGTLIWKTTTRSASIRGYVQTHSADLECAGRSECQ